MGNYLNKPNLEKHGVDGLESIYPFRWAVSDMQGWRMSMEDAYFLDFENFKKDGLCALGIFDGHGGSHVAKYVAQHISEYLSKFINIHNGDLLKALESCYMALDSSLGLPETQEELSQLSISKRDYKFNIYPFTNHKGEMANKIVEEPKLNNHENGHSSEPLIDENLHPQIVLENLESDDEEKDNTKEVEDEHKLNLDLHNNADATNKENESPKKLKKLLRRKVLKPNINTANGRKISKKLPLGNDDLKHENSDPSSFQSDEAKHIYESKFLLSNSSNPLETFKRYFLKKFSRFSPTSPSLAMNAGCTAITCLITESDYIVANVGDSRCVLCRGKKAIDLSKDHKPELDDEKNRIILAGGFLEAGRVNGNLNLSRALGDLTYKQNLLLPQEKQIISCFPEVTTTPKSDEDEFLIIACDGIWESFTSQEIIDFVLDKIEKSTKLSCIIDKLFETLISPDPEMSELGCDNMTAIIIDLKKSRHIQ